MVCHPVQVRRMFSYVYSQHSFDFLASFVVVHIDVADGPGEHEAGSFGLGDLEQPFEHLSFHHRYVVIPPLLLGKLVSL